MSRFQASFLTILILSLAIVSPTFAYEIIVDPSIVIPDPGEARSLKLGLAQLISQNKHADGEADVIRIKANLLTQDNATVKIEGTAGPA